MPLASCEEALKPVEVHLSGKETQAEVATNEHLQQLSTVFSHRMVDHTIYRGMLLNATVPPEAIDALEVRDDDVITGGYPKSGKQHFMHL
jgi:hypothetical protein